MSNRTLTHRAIQESLDRTDGTQGPDPEDVLIANDPRSSEEAQQRAARTLLLFAVQGKTRRGPV